MNAFDLAIQILRKRKQKFNIQLLDQYIAFKLGRYPKIPQKIKWATIHQWIRAFLEE